MNDKSKITHPLPFFPEIGGKGDRRARTLSFEKVKFPQCKRRHIKFLCGVVKYPSYSRSVAYFLPVPEL